MVHALCKIQKLLILRNHLFPEGNCKLIGAGDTYRIRSLVIVSLIADLIVASRRIMPEIKSLRPWRPQPDIHRQLVLGQAAHGIPGRILFPEITDAQHHASCLRTHSHATLGPVAVLAVQETELLSCQLFLHCIMTYTVLVNVINIKVRTGSHHLIKNLFFRFVKLQAFSCHLSFM